MVLTYLLILTVVVGYACWRGYQAEVWLNELSKSVGQLDVTRDCKVCIHTFDSLRSFAKQQFEQGQAEISRKHEETQKTAETERAAREKLENESLATIIRHATGGKRKPRGKK